MQQKKITLISIKMNVYTHKFIKETLLFSLRKNKNFNILYYKI